MHNILTKHSGFTLVEAAIYVALFALIVSAGLSATYNLITSTSDLDGKTLTEVEAHFVLHSLGYAVQTADIIEVISPNNVRIVENGVGTTEFTFTNASGTLYVAYDDGVPQPLNSNFIHIVDIEFKILDPLGISVDLELNDTVFEDVRYYSHKH